MFTCSIELIAPYFNQRGSHNDRIDLHLHGIMRSRQPRKKHHFSKSKAYEETRPSLIRESCAHTHFHPSFSPLVMKEKTEKLCCRGGWSQ